MSAPSLELSIAISKIMSSRTAVYVHPHRRLSPIAPSNDPIVRLIQEGSEVYSNWLDVKNAYGENSAVEQSYRARREQRGSNPNVYESSLYRDQFMSAIDDINLQAGGIMWNVGTFLDLGCAPGGFSKWLLGTNQAPRGFGLSLPVKDAGLPMQMGDWSQVEQSRYKFVEANILDDPESLYPLIRDFFSRTPVDLVVCGARHGIGNPIVEPETSEDYDQSCHDRIILSQLLIAFRTLAPGGTLVLLTTLKISFRIIDNLVFLREHFSIITPTKAWRMHGTRSSYYLVCQGFVLDETRKMDAIRRLEMILQGLTEENRIIPRLSMFEGSELDLAKEESDYLINHFTPMCNHQIQAMRCNMQRLNSGRGYLPWGQGRYRFRRS